MNQTKVKILKTNWLSHINRFQKDMIIADDSRNMQSLLQWINDRGIAVKKHNYICNIL